MIQLNVTEASDSERKTIVSTLGCNGYFVRLERRKNAKKVSEYWVITNIQPYKEENNERKQNEK